jgi:two-component sensor histidine kinase
MTSYVGEKLNRGHSWDFSLAALLGLFTLAALLPFLAFGAYATYVSDRNARLAEISNLSVHASALMQAVDRELRGHIETAEAISEARSLRRRNYDEFWEHAEAVAARAGGHFILIDHTNQQLVNTRSPRGSALPKTANAASVAQVFASGEATVGNLGVGAVAQQVLFSVRVPVVIDGKINYVLSYVPRSSAIFDVVRQTFRPEGWSAVVIDGNGRIAARSDRHNEFFGKQMAPEFIKSLQDRAGLLASTGVDGVESLTAYYASGLSDWKVVVWAPKALLEQSASRNLRLLLLLTMGALAASLLAAYLAGRLIRTPTRQLLEAAHGLSQSKVTTFRPSLMREANFVGRALDQAARTIKARDAALAEREAHLNFVIKELSHRSKNLLAVVQALASQSARSTGNIATFVTRFKERLAGIARSHNLLVTGDWSSVPIADLVRSQLEPFVSLSESRVTIRGPLLLLKPEAAQSLGLAFHELATNAIKHGSLSVSSGQVWIEWDTRTEGGGEERVRVQWREIGGPECVDPKGSNGFGHTILTKVVPSGLHGSAELKWKPEGFEWVLEAPAKLIEAHLR